jgi:hypothetical protein
MLIAGLRGQRDILLTSHDAPSFPPEDIILTSTPAYEDEIGQRALGDNVLPERVYLPRTQHISNTAQ